MEKRTDYSWMPQAMPGVAKLVAMRRKEVGNAHVDLCWRRGVVQQLPGWFYAREGALSVGTPFVGSEVDTVLKELGAWEALRGEPLLVLKNPEDVGEDDGAN